MITTDRTPSVPAGRRMSHGFRSVGPWVCVAQETGREQPAGQWPLLSDPGHLQSRTNTDPQQWMMAAHSVSPPSVTWSTLTCTHTLLHTLLHFLVHTHTVVRWINHLSLNSMLWCLPQHGHNKSRINTVCVYVCESWCFGVCMYVCVCMCVCVVGF